MSTIIIQFDLTFSKKIFSFFLLFSHNIFCQEVLWATKVLEKSSETVDEIYSPKHRAIQILGKPNVLPQTISSPCAWRPTGSGFGEDYIKVSFEKPLKVKQVIIAESVNPGTVARIFGYNASGEEILLYENQATLPRLSGRTWNVIIPETKDEIVAVKLLIVHSISKGMKEIDAVGISDSDAPVVSKINIAPNVPQDLEKVNLGSNINSKFGEVAPIVSPDNKYLYFTRLNHPENIKEKGNKNPEIAQDVWVAKASKNDNWEMSTNIGEPINNASNNATVAISADGNSLFLLNVLLPNGKSINGLSKASKKSKKWETPKQILMHDFQTLEVYDEKLRTKKNNTEYAISADEKYLISGLRRSETFGDRDLYFASRLIDGSYSKPINLGPMINSAGNEGSPFLAADNKTLYFNSNGHAGYGDADIYVTTRLDETWTNWTEPINLGPKINSAEWDGYITIPASGENAYFSSRKNSIGSDDIFKIKLFPAIKPQLVSLYDLTFKDKFTGMVLKPEITIEMIPEDTKKDSIKTVTYTFEEETKEFKTILSAGYKYIVRATLFTYSDFVTTIDLTKEKRYREVKSVFEILPIGKGQKMILNSLLFDQGKAIIKEVSFEELDKIKSLMKDNSEMEILLEGHTDNQGDMLLNIKLAENRVKAVKDYLTSDNIISPDRIKFKSWGPYKPLVRNSTEEERKKNRRVEFSITKM